MKTSFRFLILFCLFPALLSTTCHSPSGKCSEDIACTMMFAMVAVEVKNSAQQPIQLDEAYTLRKTGNEIIRPGQVLDNGHYIILDDGYQKKLALQTDTFFFIGKLNGVEVIHEPFSISADCCHIQKQSGKTVIIL